MPKRSRRIRIPQQKVTPEPEIQARSQAKQDLSTLIKTAISEAIEALYFNYRTVAKYTLIGFAMGLPFTMSCLRIQDFYYHLILKNKTTDLVNQNAACNMLEDTEFFCRGKVEIVSELIKNITGTARQQAETEFANEIPVSIGSMQYTVFFSAACGFFRGVKEANDERRELERKARLNGFFRGP